MRHPKIPEHRKQFWGGLWISKCQGSRCVPDKEAALKPDKKWACSVCTECCSKTNLNLWRPTMLASEWRPTMLTSGAYTIKLYFLTQSFYCAAKTKLAGQYASSPYSPVGVQTVATFCVPYFTKLLLDSCLN